MIAKRSMRSTSAGGLIPRPDAKITYLSGRPNPDALRLLAESIVRSLPESFWQELARNKLSDASGRAERLPSEVLATERLAMVEHGTERSVVQEPAGA